MRRKIFSHIFAETSMKKKLKIKIAKNAKCKLAFFIDKIRRDTTVQLFNTRRDTTMQQFNT